MMNTIKWPKDGARKSHTRPTDQVLLPELDLIDADYEAAAEALRKLEDCFSEVVFVHEVAARHCRERQLAASLRNQATEPDLSHARDFIKQWQKPTPLAQFGAQNSALHRTKR